MGISKLSNILPYQCYITVVPKQCSTEPKGSATISQRIHGYISVMTTFKNF
jgi:hypothetical protein